MIKANVLAEEEKKNCLEVRQLDQCKGALLWLEQYLFGEGNHYAHVLLVGREVLASRTDAKMLFFLFHHMDC